MNTTEDIDKNSLKQILVDEFKKSLAPKFENNWFLGPSSFLSINVARAVEIRRQCYSRDFPDDPIREVYIKTRFILFDTYRATLSDCLTCLSNYIKGKEPKAPYSLNFDECKENYGSNLWIRFNLSCHMQYAVELEKVFDEIEKDDPAKLKNQCFRETQGWALPRLAIRKIIGSNLSDDGEMQFHSEFNEGIESIIKFFQIPKKFIRNDADTFAHFYGKLLENI